MKKFYKLTALVCAFTMVMGTAVFAADSPSTANTTATIEQAKQTAAPAYSEGVTAAASDGTAVTLTAVNVATVNNASIAAKMLVGANATVYKAVMTTPVNGNLTMDVSGLPSGAKIVVLAFDPITGGWVKIAAKVRNGKVTFKATGYQIFSLVSDAVAP